MRRKDLWRDGYGGGAARRGYTLVEVLVVVTVLGIAGAMVVPAFSQTGALRVQGAVRTLVADMTVAQSDAIAFQEGRAIVFDKVANSYIVAQVKGTTIDTDLDAVESRTIGGEEFGGAIFETIDLDDDTLIFDEMGGPVTSPGGDVAAPSGHVDITGGGDVYRVNIDAYTGRISVERLLVAAPPGGGTGS